MYQIIIQAIEKRNLLSFTYKNEYRLIEPYTYGISTKGTDVLSAYQVDGDSNSSDILGWRLFSIENIKNLQTLTDTFIPNRDGYNPNDTRMIRIHKTV